MGTRNMGPGKRAKLSWFKKKNGEGGAAAEVCDRPFQRSEDRKRDQAAADAENGTGNATATAGAAKPKSAFKRAAKKTRDRLRGVLERVRKRRAGKTQTAQGEAEGAAEGVVEGEGAGQGNENGNSGTAAGPLGNNTSLTDNNEHSAEATPPQHSSASGSASAIDQAVFDGWSEMGASALVDGLSNPSASGASASTGQGSGTTAAGSGIGIGSVAELSLVRLNAYNPYLTDDYRVEPLPQVNGFPAGNGSPAGSGSDIDQRVFDGWSDLGTSSSVYSSSTGSVYSRPQGPALEMASAEQLAASSAGATDGAGATDSARVAEAGAENGIDGHATQDHAHVPLPPAFTPTTMTAGDPMVMLSALVVEDQNGSRSAQDMRVQVQGHPGLVQGVVDRVVSGLEERYEGGTITGTVVRAPEWS